MAMCAKTNAARQVRAILQRLFCSPWFTRLQPSPHMIARPLQTFVFALTLTTVVAPVAASPVSGQGTWESELQARDINSDGLVDAYYDTALNLTWLADANFAKTS